ncbi:oligosaccharide flippase family protein [Gilvibacter sp.]|uniref:oligosaccharide flippase family protein n=1 Tax=Gilvibacter sp. TaxID=2729997 RepID=UPI003F4A5CC6
MHSLAKKFSLLSPQYIWSILRTPAQLFTISAVLVNAGNYAYNVWLGRSLSPDVFAEAVLLITLLLALSFLATGIQLTATKFYAELEGTQKEAGMAFMSRYAIILGVVIGLLIVAFAPNLATLFSMRDVDVFYPLGVSVPFYLWLSITRGKAQGGRKYIALAATYQIEMLARFAITLLAIQVFNLDPSWSVALAIGGSVILASGVNPHKLALFQSFSVSKKLQKRIGIFFMYICLYECLQIVCSNADLLMVKHYFSAADAGQYAAMALIGRIVFFITWMIVMLLLPEVVTLRKNGGNHLRLFLKYLSGIAAIVFVLVVGCYLFSEQIVTIMFTDAYLEVAPLLGPYALATGCFALANVFVYYALSVDRYRAVWIALGFGALQLVTFTLFHESLKSIVYIQVFYMSLLMLTQAFLLIQRHKRENR